MLTHLMLAWYPCQALPQVFFFFFCKVCRSLPATGFHITYGRQVRSPPSGAQAVVAGSCRAEARLQKPPTLAAETIDGLSPNNDWFATASGPVAAALSLTFAPPASLVEVQPWFPVWKVSLLEISRVRVLRHLIYLGWPHAHLLSSRNY